MAAEEQRRREEHRQHVTREEFLDLREKHLALASSVQSLHGELKSNTEVTSQLKSELQANTDSTQRTEDKIDTVITNTGNMLKAFNNAEGAFNTLEWLGKVGLKVGWILVPTGILWSWASGNLKIFVKWLSLLKGG